MLVSALCVVCCVTGGLGVAVVGDTDDSVSAPSQCRENPTRSNVLLQTVNTIQKAVHLGTTVRENTFVCDEASWPDKDHGLICGECKVLVHHFNSVYGSCREYCKRVGRKCVSAWEEVGDTCTEDYAMTCDQSLASSDAICECGAELRNDETMDQCYGELPNLAVDEGREVGRRIATNSAAECQQACTEQDDCKSITLCPQWNSCFMKDRALRGGEPSRAYGECKTYFKLQDGCPTSGAGSTSLATVQSTSSVTTTLITTSVSMSHSCYDSLPGIAVNEGNSVGTPITTASAATCQQRCNANSGCRSFTLCPGWNQCFMKDLAQEGSVETTQQHSSAGCKTYYQTTSCTTTTTTACSGSSCQAITVMSYNTEYKNYNARMAGYAAKIREVRPTLVGLQECQNRDGLASLSSYTANMETGHQNYMLFDPSGVTFVSGGYMRIPRDRYAERFITWGKFQLGGTFIWFFNTHLPHNHDEAASPKTHAKIARMFLRKRTELGADDAPTIMVGDMNSHASHFNSVEGGGFESNLVANGFTLAYSARGNPGYGNIDHILYSSAHWSHNNCRDTGTGGSDHTSITCDLQLK